MPARPGSASTTPWGPARWAPTTRMSSTPACGYVACVDCAWWTPRYSRPCHPATPPRRRLRLPGAPRTSSAPRPDPQPTAPHEGRSRGLLAQRGASGSATNLATARMWTRLAAQLRGSARAHVLTVAAFNYYLAGDAVRGRVSLPSHASINSCQYVGCAASGVLARHPERTGEAGGDEDVLGNQVVDGRAAEAHQCRVDAAAEDVEPVLDAGL